MIKRRKKIYKGGGLNLKKGNFAELFIDSEVAQRYEERKEKIEKGGLSMKIFDENTFMGNKPDWLKGLFKKVDDFCLSEKKGVKRTFLETYCRYTYKGKMFCKVKSTTDSLKVFLRLRFSEIENPPRQARDYEPIAHQVWTELNLIEGDLIENETILLDQVYELIKKSFDRVLKHPKLSKFPSFGKKAVAPNFITDTKFKVDLEILTDGFCTLKIRVYKNQLTEILEKIIR